MLNRAAKLFFALLIQTFATQGVAAQVADGPSDVSLLNRALGNKFSQTARTFRPEFQRATMGAASAAIPGVARAEVERAPDSSRRYLTYAGYGIALLLASLAGWAYAFRKSTKQRIAALGENEQRFRRIIDTIPIMVWSVRPDGVVDFLNQRWIDYAGLSLQEYVKNPMGVIHPDDVAGVLEKWRAAVLAGKPYEDEMRLRRADGEFRRFLVRTAPFRDEHGEIVKWFGSSVDTEDLRRTEMQSRVLIDAIPQQIWSGPPDGTLDYCNAVWRSYMGLNQKDLQDDGWQTMLHPDDRERVLRAWTQSVTHGEPYEMEERHRGADGLYRWFLSRGLPLRDSEGRIVRWYGTNTDIEDRKRAEEAVRRSEQQLQALVGRMNTIKEDEAKRIARELHDDLGQKLTALNMGLSDLELKLPDISSSQRALIAQMHSTVDQTIEAVQEISGELRLGQLDVLGLTAAVEWHLKEFAGRSKIPCYVARLDEIQNLSEAQSIAAFRALQEALTNVARHAGATRIEVSLQREASQLILRIHDNGRGIKAAESSDRNALGLLGMRERVQSVGGTLAITGEIGEGTTVLVTIPVTPNDAHPV